MMFRRPRMSNGVYSAIVKARSSEEPGQNFSYTVVIDTEAGEIEMEGVATDPDRRWTTVFPTLNLVPFRVNALVEVHMRGPAHSQEVFITTPELPDAGPCPTGGTP